MLGTSAIGNTTLGATLGPTPWSLRSLCLPLSARVRGEVQKGAALAVLANQLPNIAILGLVIAISAAVLDIYELPALLPLLGFGLTVAFLTTLLRVILQLGGWAKDAQTASDSSLRACLSAPASYLRLSRAVAGLKRADKMRPQGDEVSAQSPRPYTARSKAVKAATDSLSIKGST